jgi:alkylated DNA repair protein (DNA oxidative demethylase)
MKSRGAIQSLFDDADVETPRTTEKLGPDAILLRGFALDFEKELLQALDRITATAPFRHMVTPGGYRMSVAMTNCGALGWITDRRGYRYDGVDPDSGRPWPKMPASFLGLSDRAAREAGFDGFVPDACLINQYEPGSRLTLHQDRNEKDFRAPIVSVSLGLPATFLFGGSERTDRTKRFALRHGDVAVWGGKSRLFFHGVAPLKDGEHETLGRRRINLTLRLAGGSSSKLPDSRATNGV